MQSEMNLNVPKDLNTFDRVSYNERGEMLVIDLSGRTHYIDSGGPVLDFFFYVERSDHFEGLYRNLLSGLSRNTFVAYRGYLEDFREACLDADRFPVWQEWKALGADALLFYRDVVMGRGFSEGTAKNHVSAIKRLYKFIEANEGRILNWIISGISNDGLFSDFYFGNTSSTKEDEIVDGLKAMKKIARERESAETVTRVDTSPGLSIFLNSKGEDDSGFLLDVIDQGDFIRDLLEVFTSHYGNNTVQRKKTRTGQPYLQVRAKRVR